MLTIHFLNVGKGSCTILQFPSGRVALVDICDTGSVTEDEAKSSSDDELTRVAETVRLKEYAVYKSVGMGRFGTVLQDLAKAYNSTLTNPVAYLHELNCPSVFRLVVTHPHMDHISGLGRLRREVTLVNFWDTDNPHRIDPSEWERSPWRKEDWDEYVKLRTSMEDPKVLRLGRGDSNRYWSEDGIEILAPTSNLIEMATRSGDCHHSSYVLRVTYKGVSVILGGDASYEVWDDIWSTYSETELKAHVLLAPHHGSANNFHEAAFKAIAPEIIVVSVALGTDYDYDHYSKIGKVLSTKYYGNIVVSVDDDGKGVYATQHHGATT